MKTSLFKAIGALCLTLAALAAHADPSMADGEVKAVDQAGSNVTLKHGPIKSKTVEMPGMTMSFSVQKPSLLEGVKIGDKVKFNVENVNGTATITTLRVQE